MANFVLQLLRNSALLSDRAAAIAALEGKVAGRKDGEMVLARYTNGESVSAVLGIINKVGNKNVLTVLEDNVNAVPTKIAEAISSAKGQLESAYKEADAKIREDFAAEDTKIRGEFAAEDTKLSNRIASLEGLVGGGEAGGVSDQIKAAIEDLDVATIGGAGKFIQSVEEADGKISAVAMDATAANIAIADAAGKFTAENVEAALAEIHTGYTGEASAIRGEFAAADKTLKEGYEAADKAINDKIGTVAEGKTVVGMIEEAANAAAAAHSKVAKDANAAHLTITPTTDENGAVTYTIGETNIASADALSGVDGRLGTAEGKIATLEGLMGEGEGSVGSRIEAAVEEAVEGLMGETSETDAKTIAALNDKIEAVEAAAKSYEIKAVTEGLGTNVKEAFALFDEDGKQAGSTINIYKDSSLKEVKLDADQKLQFTYILFDGSESTVGVDVSSFLSESEFGNGLQVVDHIVSVKVDAASENFLTVGADGIKLAGVADAIKAADDKVREDFAAVDSAIRGEFAAEDTKIRGEFAAEDTKLSNRIASLEGLVGVGEDAEGVDARIEAAIEALDSEKTGDGTFVDVTVKQENGVITSVSVAENNIAKADELDAAEGKIAALEGLVGTTAVATQIDNKVATLNSDKTADGTFVDVVLKQVNGVITSFTISENNIAKADELDAAEGKIAALEGLVGTTAVGTQIDNKIGALNVTDTAVAGQYVSQVSESAGKIAVTRNALLGAETDNALSMGANGGIYMSTTLDCGQY